MDDPALHRFIPIYDDEPGHEMDRHWGVSHISKKVGPITYCSACEHWFNREDRVNYFGRSFEALLQIIGGRREGCCGPVKR